MEIKGPADEVLWKEMLLGNDRTCCVVAVAHLDESLTMLLKSRLKQDQKAFNTLFDPERPAGTLGAKRQLGYLMALYSKEFSDEIKVVAGIRNKFAHRASPLYFDDAEIKKEVLKLRIYKDLGSFGFHPDPSKGEVETNYTRYIFTSGVDHLSSALRIASRHLDHPPLP
jgi:hypothetical protein